MTPNKIRTFRIKLTNELWKSFPRTEAATIWQAAARIERLMVFEAFKLVDMEHERDCGCWNCVMTLHSDVARRLAEQRAAHEAAEEHD